jgi:transposase
MTPYPSDLTDAQWNVLEPLMPIVALGRPRTHALRTIVNAVFYVLRGGIAWRSLPHEEELRDNKNSSNSRRLERLGFDSSLARRMISRVVRAVRGKSDQLRLSRNSS